MGYYEHPVSPSIPLQKAPQYNNQEYVDQNIFDEIPDQCYILVSNNYRSWRQEHTQSTLFIKVAWLAVMMLLWPIWPDRWTMLGVSTKVFKWIICLSFEPRGSKVYLFIIVYQINEIHRGKFLSPQTTYYCIFGFFTQIQNIDLRSISRRFIRRLRVGNLYSYIKTYG